MRLRAYVIGLALGDGNLSNPNGRAQRLRITCDTKYPMLIETIKKSLQELLPENKVFVIKNVENCVDVICHSNHLENLLGWKAKGGSKMKQNVRVPTWIFNDPFYSSDCLRGLFQSDGCIYNDRGYIMANFTSAIESLTCDVFNMIESIGFEPKLYKVVPKGRVRYTIRISKHAEDFIFAIQLVKR